MPQRDWGKLGESTRKRYTGAGFKQRGMSPAEVQAYYQSGGDLKGLRGHGKTPESIADVVRSESPEQFRKYIAERQNVSGGTWDREQWAKKYVKNFERHFESNPKYNSKSIKENSQITDPADKYYIHTDELIKGANSSQTELVALATDKTKDYGKRSNPFYYH